MAAKEVRPLLSALSTDSLISIQEVPKSADRNPTRTFYLWHVSRFDFGISLTPHADSLRHVDLPKAYSVLLRNFYKTLYNISVRRQAEEGEPRVKAVLEKQQRSDVSQDENLLTKMEREILKEWENKREMFTILEMRVEEVVFILRDLAHLDTNDD